MTPSGRNKGYWDWRVVSVSTYDKARGHQRSKSQSLVRQGIAMHLSWPEHLQNARLLELSPASERGTALALMGISLLLLAQDLLAAEIADGTADKAA